MRKAIHPVTGIEAGIRTKALRAAATVAVLIGGGCSADSNAQVYGVVDVGGGADSGVVGDAAGADVAAADVQAGSEVQAESDVAAAGDIQLADTAGDGGEVHVCDINGDPDAYQACCEAVQWDFDKGCMAWGPPAPLAMMVLT